MNKLTYDEAEVIVGDKILEVVEEMKKLFDKMELSSIATLCVLEIMRDQTHRQAMAMEADND